jgi:hypothetical protein
LSAYVPFREGCHNGVKRAYRQQIVTGGAIGYDVAPLAYQFYEPSAIYRAGATQR